MRTFFLGFLLLATTCTFSQTLTSANVQELRRNEDSLKLYGQKMIMEKTASQRFIADSIFIRSLVHALKTPNSFYYPFDSLQTVSHIYSPDSAFRIFSWQFSRDENYFRQRGAIQMKTADGSLKLYPLIDISDFTNAPEDSNRTNQNWIGAIYYNVLVKTYNGKKYYTLMGFDDNNMRSSKKWIEVLTFDNAQRPVFGGSFKLLENDSIRAARQHARFCLEYKKDGQARMNYDKDMDLIMYDHLVSENNQPDNPSTYVPDGDYQAFKWTNGSWTQIDKVFDYKLQDGQAPVPMPIKDAAGKTDETRLMEQSEKNKQKQQPAKPKSPAKKN